MSPKEKIKLGGKVMFGHNESVTVLVDNLGINLRKLLGKPSEQIKKRVRLINSEKEKT